MLVAIATNEASITAVFSLAFKAIKFQLTKNWDAISTLNVSRRDVGKILKKNSRWYFAIFLIYTRLFLTEKKFLLKACLRNTNVEMSKNEK